MFILLYCTFKARGKNNGMGNRLVCFVLCVLVSCLDVMFSVGLRQGGDKDTAQGQEREERAEDADEDEDEDEDEGDDDDGDGDGDDDEEEDGATATRRDEADDDDGEDFSDRATLELMVRVCVCDVGCGLTSSHLLFNVVISTLSCERYIYTYRKEFGGYFVYPKKSPGLCCSRRRTYKLFRLLFYFVLFLW